jgi:carbamoyltransferase
VKKFIIGISAFYHDSSVCLFKDGELVFACEEEKFTGIKHDSSFPVNTLNYIFKRYRIKKSDVEAVCYYEDPTLKLERVKSNIKPLWFKKPFYSLKSYLNIKKNIREINKHLPQYSDKVFFSTHHESHLYYSYYTSHFDNATCLSIDGVGEFDTMSLGIAKGNDMEYLSMSEYPHSVGLFYSAMTAFLGFKPNEGEYKVMGLASYGNPQTYIEKVRELINYKNGKLTCNLDVFTWDRDNKIMFNHKLGEMFDMLPRISDEKIENHHMDLAAAVQMRYEEVLFEVIKTIKIIDDNNKLCLSGGCAYNGTANGKIVKETHINSIWIPPAPSDAGSSIGACVHYMVKNKLLTSKINRNPFLGPIYFHNDIQGAIKGRRYKKFLSDRKLREYVAKKLSEGKVVGWFQGHCEFGSRALGNRSILADPTVDGMKDRINKVIKKREGFRPFAPMVIKDKQDIYFEMTDDIPYMNQVVKVKPEYRNILKAVTHVDGSARVQTVYKNTLIYELLLEFEKLSGYPILLNTSFNIKDKTMVLTPQDAIDTFYDTDLDVLVIDNIIIEKRKKYDTEID